MVLVVATFTFLLTHLLPGDPISAAVAARVAQGIPPDEAASRVASLYGWVPHDPLPIQYRDYLLGLARFDLGHSISYQGIPVSRLIGDASHYTVPLVLLGLIASFLIGVAAGVLAALRRGSALGSGLSISGSLLHGVPQFVIALLLAYVFTTLLPLLPLGSPYDADIQPGLTPDFIGSLASHAVLPVLAYALSGFGGWLLITRSSVVSVLGEDFILAAELRGVSPWLRFRYVARNAMLPLFTILALAIGFVFSGSVFIERVFDYPGLGTLLITSVGARDYPLMNGAFLFITVAVIVMNSVADLVYVVIDPRVRA